MPDRQPLIFGQALYLPNRLLKHEILCKKLERFFLIEYNIKILDNLLIEELWNLML